MQNLTNQAPPFLESLSMLRQDPSCNDAHFTSLLLREDQIGSEVYLLVSCDGAQHITLNERLAIVLQRSEEVKGHDFNAGGASRYLK